MEDRAIRTSLVNSDAVTAVASAATNGNDSNDNIYTDTSTGSYKPLPLSNFKAYWNLVSALYSTSLAVMLGNSLEWLDFSIYGYSNAEISSQLFGGSKAAYWATFGLGFAVRPLGAYVLGKLSDEKSRKLSFILSMLAMSVSTALMSLIPAVCNMPDVTLDSYCVSNLWASVIPAVLLRCVQGFSAGAAAGGVNVIQTELWSTTERKGVIAQSVGVQNVSGGGASMVSAAVVFGLRATMGQVRYAAWGWRLAFLIVVPPSLFASYLMNKSMPESNDFAKRDGHIEEETLLVEDVSENGDKDKESSKNQFQDVQSSSSSSSSDEDNDNDEFLDEDAPICTTDDDHGSSSMRRKSLRRNKTSSTSLSSSRLRDTSFSANNSANDGDDDDDDDDDDDEPENTNTNTTPWWLLISVMIFSQFAISAFNNLNVFLVEFAQTNYGVTANTSILMQVAGKAVQVLMTPFAAILGDIKGWYWACAFGGTLCTILALPMMVVGNFGGVAAAWILVSGCLPIVSTFWILNAPLLATSAFSVDCRSRGTSLVLATATGIAGFLPLVLEEIPNAFAQGGVLTVIAALGTIGILWIRNRAKNGNVIIYQRPELY